MSNEKLAAAEIVAERAYIARGKGWEILITARIGLPRLGADGRYECGAELEEPDRTTLRYMNGADAIEALQLAIIILGVDLKHINEQLGGSLQWSGAESGLGLPSYPDFSLKSVLGGDFE
jgi:hypothetical protein